MPQDYEQAIAWWRKSADQGEAMAQNNLGVSYVHGRGVPQDYVLAHMWFNLAASRASDAETRNAAASSRDSIADQDDARSDRRGAKDGARVGSEVKHAKNSVSGLGTGNEGAPQAERRAAALASGLLRRIVGPAIRFPPEAQADRHFTSQVPGP